MSPPAAGVDTSKLTFYENFLLGGAAAVTSKTAAAPLERTKLLIQNQGELLKSGRLDKPYKGIVECMGRTFKNEGNAFDILNTRNKTAEMVNFAPHSSRWRFQLLSSCAKLLNSNLLSKTLFVYNQVSLIREIVIKLMCNLMLVEKENCFCNSFSSLEVIKPV